MLKDPTLEQFIDYALNQACSRGGTIQIKNIERNHTEKIQYLIGPNMFSAAMPVLKNKNQRLTPAVVSSLCAKLGISPPYKKDFS